MKYTSIVHVRNLVFALLEFKSALQIYKVCVYLWNLSLTSHKFNEISFHTFNEISLKKSDFSFATERYHIQLVIVEINST